MSSDLTGLSWDKLGGLIPAVIQDSLTGRVLMLGFMNPEALDRTVESGRVTFWSRSRRTLWTKGETSGNYLQVDEIREDCDSDTLLVLATPKGPACHRGKGSCFEADGEAPYAGGFLLQLEQLIQDRRRTLPEGSYTTTLFREGPTQIGKKLGEEAVETILSAWEDRERTVSETADLLYHLLVFLVSREVSWVEVLEELAKRHRARA